MTTKIGRNDPCPCGSGKKYKNCCLRKRQQSDRLPGPTFPEEFVIGELLRSSKEFLAFYQAERGKIAGTVHWAQDPSLPEGIDYRSTRLPTGDHVIPLRRIPATLEDAMKIAHELEHIVLDAEGFPRTGARPEFETLSSALNSMVNDPIVDSRLEVYGFDLWDDYQTELGETCRQLRADRSPPSDHLSRMLWIFNYVGKILAWELVHNKRDRGENEFQLCFDARYPHIAEEARELLALVKDIGYDTPQKQSALFSAIIQRYDLGRYIVL